MSNPAVITLAEAWTSFGPFRVEDNIGEAIHLHLGEFRYDLSISDFLLLADDIEESVKEYTSNIPGFCFDQISKEFFLSKAYCWPDLKEARVEKIKLSELMVDTYDSRGRYSFLPLPNSRVIKALNGDSKENDSRKERNYYGQTNNDRLLSMLESIKKNGYPKDKQFIVVFNHSNVIEDGQHRAACLYYLYGDIEVEVLRLLFKDNLHTAVIRRPIKDRLFDWNRERLKRYYRIVMNNKKKILYWYGRKKSFLEISWDQKRYIKKGDYK